MQLMDVTEWITQSRERVRDRGMEGVRDSLRPVYNKGLSQYSRVKDSGTPIYDREWDLLVILDACRLDLMQEVAGSYPLVENIDVFRSLDSTTKFWMKKNFVRRYADEMRETTYVCGNPFSDSMLSADSFHELNEVWRRAWEEPGTVPPRAITDETIRAMRSSGSDRVIAHYMQPHCPFIPRPELSAAKSLERFGNQRHRDVWGRLRDGDLTREEVWEGYRLNLELGLDDVSLLLRSVDADRVVVSSDHGNALGELGVYGHPPNMPHDCLRNVPWIETTATNDGEYEPETELSEEVERSTDEQLAALGYV